MKKKILCTMISMVMVASLFAGCGTDSGKENSASDTSKTKEAGTTISVAAIETAYGSEMWQKVADAFTEETGIKVELTTDKKLEDVIGPSMQGGEYPDVIHLATGREAALTEQFIKGHMITDITDVLSMKVPGEDKLVSEKIAGGFTDTSLTNPYGDGKTYLAPMFYQRVSTPASSRRCLERRDWSPCSLSRQSRKTAASRRRKARKRIGSSRI